MGTGPAYQFRHRLAGDMVDDVKHVDRVETEARPELSRVADLERDVSDLELFGRTSGRPNPALADVEAVNLSGRRGRSEKHGEETKPASDINYVPALGQILSDLGEKSLTQNVKASHRIGLHDRRVVSQYDVPNF